MASGTSVVTAVPYPSAAVRQAAIASLIQCRDRGEPIGWDAAAAVGRVIDRSARAVYRDVARGGYTREGRERFRIEDEELTVLFESRGFERRAWRWLTANFWPAGEGPSYSQFNRAAKLDVHPYLRAAMREGDRAARRFGLAMMVEHKQPYDLLSADGKQVAVFIQHSTKRDPGFPSKPLLVRPWVLWAKDGMTRGITGMAATEDALTHRHLLSVLQQSLRGDPELGPFRGRPRAVAWDRGTIHTADAVTMAMSALAIPVHLSDAWQPQQNGLIESFNALAESDFAPGDPFYAHPPIGLDGRPFLPDPDCAPTFAQFNQSLREWVAGYNANWLHSGLGGRTPVQAWEAAEEKPDTIPEEWLRFMHLDSRQRRVTAAGVRIDNDFFTCPELDELIGCDVDVRVDDDRRTVEVFDIGTGDWRGTAVNHSHLTARQKMAIRATVSRHSRKTRGIHHAMLTSQEAALRARRAAPPTAAEADAEDAATVAVAHSRRPRGAINQPVHVPAHARPHRARRRTR